MKTISLAMVISMIINLALAQDADDLRTKFKSSIKKLVAQALHFPEDKLIIKMDYGYDDNKYSFELESIDKKHFFPITISVGKIDLVMDPTDKKYIDDVLANPNIILEPIKKMIELAPMQYTDDEKQAINAYSSMNSKMSDQFLKTAFENNMYLLCPIAQTTGLPANSVMVFNNKKYEVGVFFDFRQQTSEDDLKHLSDDFKLATPYKLLEIEKSPIEYRNIVEKTILGSNFEKDVYIATHKNLASKVGEFYEKFKADLAKVTN